MSHYSHPSASLRSNRDEPVIEGWAVCAAAMRTYDDEIVRGWNNEIDALLLLAGLISSVITTFLVESYQLLQPAQDSPPPNKAAIRVNTLWSISLILALATALYGTILKQWLREHIRWRALSPRDTVRLREIRREAFVYWGVGQLIAGLPTLIQISLMMFFIGLLDYLWQILRFWTVAIPSTIIASILMLYFIATVFVPSFSPACAWKTAPGLWLRLISLAVHVKSTPSHTQSIRQTLRQFSGGMSQLYNLGMRAEGWWESDVSVLRACDAARMQQLDENALVWAHRTIIENTEPSVDSVIASCLNDIPALKRASLLITLIADAASSSVAVILDSGAHTSSFALVHWQHVIDGLTRSGASTIERLIFYLLSTVNAVGDPVQTLHVYVDTDMTLSRQVNLIKLLHILLVALQNDSNGIRREQWLRVQELLIHVSINHQSVAALQMLSSFDLSFGVYITLDDINRYLDAVMKVNSVNNPQAIIDDEFFVSAVFWIMRQSSRLLPNIDLALRKMLVTPRLRNLTRQMSGHLHCATSRGQRYHASDISQAMWSPVLLALARADADALDWTEIIPALQDAEHAGLLMAHEESCLRELVGMMVL